MDRFANRRIALTPALVFLVAAFASAQKRTPSVQEVLAHARASISATAATLPDVFCDEKIESSELHNGKVSRKMTFDSVISARKLESGDDKLTESRDVRLVDGKPPKRGKKYLLPILLNGGFGIRFYSSLFSANDQCNAYRIVEGGALEGNLLELEVSRKVNSKQIAGCEELSEGAVYRFWLDPVSYLIQRVQSQVRLPDGSRGFKSLAGRSDFAMVQIGPRSYPLPANFHTTMTMEPNSSEQFTFEAHYSNCHKFEATSSIVADPVEESH
jgi:hypothetical protein